MLDLRTPIEKFARLKTSQQKALEKLGLKTIRDLLFHFPFRYENYSLISPIADISAGEVFTVTGKIIDFSVQRTWKKRMLITEALLQDESGAVRALWFGQKFLQTSLKIGKEIRLSGKLSADEKGLYFSNPAWEFSMRQFTHTGRLVPVYPESEGITSRWLRWQLELIFKKGFSIPDPLPEKTRAKLHLPEINSALRRIHFPQTESDYIVARKRFAFEEMLILQIKFLRVRAKLKKENSATIKFNSRLIKKFIGELPFTPTNAQKKAAFQILKDLEKPQPMNRLLNGDVGSGKTLVAAIAALQTSVSGFQTVILAPTEVLARQHFESFCEIFKNYNLNIGLLTNSYKLTCHSEFTSESHKKSWKIPKQVQNDNKKNTNIIKTTRPKLLEEIKNGDIDILIGTHAIIQKDVKFEKLALVVIDEQHRFGVAQRAYLQQETAKINDGLPKKIPHLLSMTATPIPRTLTMAFFGNLDVSFLDEMPKNRKPIITRLIAPTEKEKIYAFVRDQIRKGRQIFIILPLVEESKSLAEVKAAISEHKRLSEEIFPDLKLGLLHGKMKPAEKEKAMQAFLEHKTDILVSTAVVEVGVDVPNASVMIIEDANRFGLSQLHQFRGRVGRGLFQSYCFLFSSQITARLKILEKSNDGFQIAEKDLELRGPGEFLGTRQSGLPDITMENIANIKLIQLSRQEALEILREDFSLTKYPVLRAVLEKIEIKIHLE